MDDDTESYQLIPVNEFSSEHPESASKDVNSTKLSPQDLSSRKRNYLGSGLVGENTASSTFKGENSGRH
jgi:hypothetical protein